MAGQHGGARVPTNPAPVSGPGALSKRTDGQPIRDLPNARYGENAEFTALQQGAPLAGLPSGGGGGGGGAAGAPARVVGFGEPSAYADQPVTAGAGAGAGPGLEALGIPQDPVGERSADVRDLAEGQIAAMVRRAQEPSASRAFKRLVREVLAYR